MWINGSFWLSLVIYVPFNWHSGCCTYFCCCCCNAALFAHLLALHIAYDICVRHIYFAVCFTRDVFSPPMKLNCSPVRFVVMNIYFWKPCSLLISALLAQPQTHRTTDRSDQKHFVSHFRCVMTRSTVWARTEKYMVPNRKIIEFIPIVHNSVCLLLLFCVCSSLNNEVKTSLYFKDMLLWSGRARALFMNIWIFLEISVENV